MIQLLIKILVLSFIADMNLISVSVFLVGAEKPRMALKVYMGISILAFTFLGFIFSRNYKVVGICFLTTLINYIIFYIVIVYKSNHEKKKYNFY